MAVVVVVVTMAVTVTPMTEEERQCYWLSYAGVAFRCGEALGARVFLKYWMHQKLQPFARNVIISTIEVSLWLIYLIRNAGTFYFVMM